MMKTIMMLISLFGFINMDANSAQAPMLDTEIAPSTSEKTAAKIEITAESTTESTTESKTESTTGSTTESKTESTKTSKKSAEAYIKSANYAKQEGNFKLVRKILKEGYQSTQEIKILSQWLVVDETALQALENKHQINSMTTWTSKFEDKCLRQSLATCSEYERQKAISNQKENKIVIPQIEEVNVILNKYKQLKGSQIHRENFLDKEFLAEEESDKKTIFEQHQKQVHNLRRNRCHYLSFDVISPYLVRTEQLIFLSKINKPEGSSLLTLVSDKSLQKVREVEILHEAAKILVNVGVQGMIFESDISIQKQFLKVYEKFKQTEGAKFEEFKKIEKIAVRLKEGKKYVSCEDR